MASSISHRGFVARVEHDPRDGIYVGRVDLKRGSVISFHGETIPDLLAAFIEAIDDYLAECKDYGIDPEEPSSGS